MALSLPNLGLRACQDTCHRTCQHTHVTTHVSTPMSTRRRTRVEVADAARLRPLVACDHVEQWLSLPDQGYVRRRLGLCRRPEGQVCSSSSYGPI